MSKPEPRYAYNIDMEAHSFKGTEPWYRASDIDPLLARVEALTAELRNWGHGEGCTVNADDDPETCSCYHRHLSKLDAAEWK